MYIVYFACGSQEDQQKFQLTGVPPSTTIRIGILLIGFDEAFLIVTFTVSAFDKPHLLVNGSSIVFKLVYHQYAS